MKKAILISIRPEWVAKILNGEKTIEIRKTAPKCELPIDVYIYCTKDEKSPINLPWEFPVRDENGVFVTDCDFKKGNGKVVAKFTLNKIENFINGMNELELEWDGKPDAEYDYFAYEKALEKACLTYEEADKYCPDQSFYAWHISDLEIFDEPKELSEFYFWKKNKPTKKDIEFAKLTGSKIFRTKRLLPLNMAPQSWQYVEVEE